MSFTFDPDHMRQDLQALSNASGSFLLHKPRMERLWGDLERGVASAKASGNPRFSWRTEEGQPIEVKHSKSWKGDTDQFDPMSGEVSLDYRCEYLPADGGRLKAIGVAVMTLRDVASNRHKVVHFDAEEGGWEEMQNGKMQRRAGHPPLHAQFHGSINDIPRLPTIIVHPVDVISFALLELHQKHWREHSSSFDCKTKLRLVPKRQRARMDAVLNRWMQVVSTPDYHALVAMQRPFREPLSL